MIKKFLQNRRNQLIYTEFHEKTMIPKEVYIDNLELASDFAGCEGSVVECGTWRGGMIAGIAKVLGPKRNYFLYDSFEGLPKAKKIDGCNAITWQGNKTDPGYFNNCTATFEEAKKTMDQSGAKTFIIKKGWFQKTVPNHPKDEKISLLRLDGDWYESTFTCLDHLFPLVVPGGLIIIDDYLVWDGCSRAVHDYMSHHRLGEKISTYKNKVPFIIKR